jgi:hypothetical protein
MKIMGLFQTSTDIIFEKSSFDTNNTKVISEVGKDLGRSVIYSESLRIFQRFLCHFRI